MASDIALRLVPHPMSSLLPSHRNLPNLSLLAPIPIKTLKEQALSCAFTPAGCRKGGNSRSLCLHSAKCGGRYETDASCVRSGGVEYDQNLFEGNGEDKVGGYNNDAAVAHEGLQVRRKSMDRWIGGCVCEIVRNIEEAPFLHMLFLTEDAASLSKRHKVPSAADKGTEEGWEEYVRDCVSQASPDGVILVHHLDHEGGCTCGDGGHCHAKCAATDRFWGVLVLGKSIVGSSCYILKTTSTSSSSSLGTCTAFCLTKAKCFGPSWYHQMQNCWLVGGETTGN